MGVLGPRLVNRALTSIPFFPWRVSPVQYIQSLLMLCTWPFPKNTVSKDSSYTLSGLLIQLSMQIGLHLPVLTQDFIRVRVTLSEHDIRKRAELWAYCVLISQRYVRELYKVGHILRAGEGRPGVYIYIYES